MGVPLVSTLLETVTETLALPLLSVVADVGLSVAAVVEEVKVTAAPALAVPSALRTVTVKLVEPPAVALNVDEVGVNDTSGWNVTSKLPEAMPAVALTVTVPAVGFVRVTLAVVPPVVVAVDVPFTKVPPVEVKETSVPSATAVPSFFFTVAVMAVWPPAPGEVGLAVTVMVAGALGSARGNQSMLPQPAIIVIRMAKIQTALFILPPKFLLIVLPVCSAASV